MDAKEREFAFGDFLETTEYDGAENALFDMMKLAFFMDWDAHKKATTAETTEETMGQLDND